MSTNTNEENKTKKSKRQFWHEPADKVEDIVVKAWKPDEEIVLVPVYAHRGSNYIKSQIPLRKFSKLFQEMYTENFFKKIFYDDIYVTGWSIHNTYFQTKVSADF